MFVKTCAAALVGIEAVVVTVEVSITGEGLHYFLVGLPDNAVKESQDRIRSAFESCGYRMTNRRVVVNLAPADLKKEGAAFDLPIAVAILAAMEIGSPELLESTMVLGELSLDGTVQPVRGVLSMAMAARAAGIRRMIVPAGCAAEAALVDGVEILSAAHLREVIAWLTGEGGLPAALRNDEGDDPAVSPYAEDFADVRGQAQAKRALEIAAAGGHNVIMVGAPGSGKTMLARRLPTILPPLTPEEALQTTMIYSVAGAPGSMRGLMRRRPFRAPHHTASRVALVGGGQSPRPGEVSLAHNGILFLDELPEFGRDALEVLRQPLEEKRVTVSRARYTLEYPAGFTLVAAMNPCPCGFYNHPVRECHCTPFAVQRYMGRISGPLMDRIDLQIEILPVEIGELTSSTRTEEPSARIRERVIRAREIQRERFREVPGVFTNAMMNGRMVRRFCRPDEASERLLQSAMTRLNLSARAYDRILKVARTIADLEGAAQIGPRHIGEAIGYRSLDRSTWGAAKLK